MINQHWFNEWHGTNQASSHYRNQQWPSSLTPSGVAMPQWIKNVAYATIQHTYKLFLYFLSIFSHLHYCTFLDQVLLKAWQYIDRNICIVSNVTILWWPLNHGPLEDVAVILIHWRVFKCIFLDRDKIAAISQTTFSMHFLGWKCMNFAEDFTGS